MPARVQEPCVSACGAGAPARVPARAFQTPGLSPPRTLRLRLWRGCPRPRPGASFSDSRPLSSKNLAFPLVARAPPPASRRELFRLSATLRQPCVSACGAGALARVPARAFQTLGHSPPRTLRFRLWRGRPRPRPARAFQTLGHSPPRTLRFRLWRGRPRPRPGASFSDSSLLAKFPPLHLPAALLPCHRYAAHRHHHSIALDHTVRHRLARLAPLHLLDAAIGNVHSSHMATSRHRQRRYQCRHFYLAVHSRAASCSIRNDCRQLKVAVISLTLLARVPSRLTVQVPAPVQAPLQPAKLWPEKEWAVKVTLVPFSMVML